MNTLQRLAAVTFALAIAGVTGCVTSEKRRQEEIENFRQSTAGLYQSDSGAELFIAPVRARMVTDEAIYMERRDAQGLFARLLNVEHAADGKRIFQRAFTFTQEGQWRNLRENTELFTALLPKDVRPAGTCDIQTSADLNSVSYSCGGSPPEIFRRK